VGGKASTSFEIEDGKIVEFTFFLDTETVFPLFGLPLQLGV
jgi:ketosteroid isomerase-like protein